ncbi:hypothetical protein GYMLUDRAFT_36783 [Collybiopsis luxurians FD-317 M1]|nr:hypothetical protein GYMLUDRAFT_36783 [Collybiopsis luxurians FD-317 M1]
MGSSELSDALNPHFSYPRNSQSFSSNHPEQLQPLIHPSQHHVPHRSELELAVSESHSIPVPRPRTSSEGQSAMQELLRVVRETSQAQENERKRRRVWEQEQEERYAQRQAELERQMMEMRQELSSLRSAFAGGPTADLHITSHHLPTLNQQQHYSPLSHVSETFVQGSSSQPIRQYAPDTSTTHLVSMSPQHGSPISSPPPSSSSASPMLSPLTVSPMGMTILSPETSRKSMESERSSDSRPSSPAHARNHYQRKCRTIQEAMRKHILHLMQVDADQNLPDSQPEGVTYDVSHPIRFVWDKTVKQSVHNMRMKTFVLDDIKLNRRLYKELPERDFSKNILESAFEQNFTTLRQIFRTQRDTTEAEHIKSRGDQRAQNARRMARRKKKLNSRAAARLKYPIFEHSTFDGALQIDCMSSEESDEEADASQPKFLYTRGYLWRSNRLLRFFHTLDQEDSTVPRRGSTKMDRAIGTPKEGISLPPKGVSGWMISRRWIRATQIKQPDLAEALKRLVADSTELPLEALYQLGGESEEDEDELEREQKRALRQGGELHMAMSQQYSSSSLQNAFSLA